MNYIKVSDFGIRTKYFKISMSNIFVHIKLMFISMNERRDKPNPILNKTKTSSSIPIILKKDRFIYVRKFTMYIDTQRTKLASIKCVRVYHVAPLFSFTAWYGRKNNTNCLEFKHDNLCNKTNLIDVPLIWWALILTI